MAKNRLGRGLASLIPKTAYEKKTKISESISEIDIKKISPNPHQPRQNFDQRRLNELVLSIKEHGILQPLILTKIADDKYQILAGERRFLAAKQAGLSKVPAIFRSASEQQKLEYALIENLQRDDLNPIEQARAYKSLISDFNLNQEKIAKKIGKSRTQIANTLRLLSLPSEVQEALALGKITFGHAKVILSLPDRAAQLSLLRKVQTDGLSVRDLEAQTKKVRPKKRSLRGQKSPEIVNLEERLKQALGTKVMINKKEKKGEILIEFYSEEELVNLVNLIAEKEEY